MTRIMFDSEVTWLYPCCVLLGGADGGASPRGRSRGHEKIAEWFLKPCETKEHMLTFTWAICQPLSILSNVCDAAKSTHSTLTDTGVCLISVTCRSDVTRLARAHTLVPPGLYMLFFFCEVGGGVVLHACVLAPRHSVIFPLLKAQLWFGGCNCLAFF